MTTRKNITMTNRAPLSIDPAQWSVIARADWHDGREYECQASRVARILVRRRATAERTDVLISGVEDSGPGGAPAGYEAARAGYLLSRDAKDGSDAAEIIATIRRVADEIGHENLAAACIADLPAEEI